MRLMVTKHSNFTGGILKSFEIRQRHQRSTESIVIKKGMCNRHRARETYVSHVIFLSILVGQQDRMVPSLANHKIMEKSWNYFPKSLQNPLTYGQIILAYLCAVSIFDNSSLCLVFRASMVVSSWSLSSSKRRIWKEQWYAVWFWGWKK